MRHYRTCVPSKHPARVARARARDLLGSVFHPTGDRYYDPFAGAFVKRR